MREPRLIQLAALAVVTLLGLTSCTGTPDPEAAEGEPAAALERDGGDEGRGEGGEHGEGSEGGEHNEGGEHDEGGEHREGAEGDEGEESGEYIARDGSWDATRRGMRLQLSFDPAGDAFTGTVENTTQETICAVRVEVHLSGSIELGPTERTDLAPGESVAVELSAEGSDFEAWTAHPEQSACSGDR